MTTKSEKCVGREKEKDSTQYYYEKAKKARAEALAMANALIGNPLKFSVFNGIFMLVEVTKRDIKTIVNKNNSDDYFNFLKNKAAKDIQGFIRKAMYEGWAGVITGKHPEGAFFVYYSKTGRRKMVLCIRKIKVTKVFKPYAILPYNIFKKEKDRIKKGTPL